LEDLEGSVEVVVFPSVYTSVAGVLQEGKIVLVRAKVSFREEKPKLIAIDIKPIEEVYKAIKSINVNLSQASSEVLRQLKEKLSLFPGKTPVYLRFNTNEFKSVEVLVGEDLFVDPNETLFEELKGFVGEDRFSIKI